MHINTRGKFHHVIMQKHIWVLEVMNFHTFLIALEDSASPPLVVLLQVLQIYWGKKQ